MTRWASGGRRQERSRSLGAALGLAPLAVALSVGSCYGDCASHWVPPCGDGVRSVGEQCDGADLGGETCESLGYGAGELACTRQCRFEISSCAPPPLCGNGVLDPGEECDPLRSFENGPVTCRNVGYAGAADVGCDAECHWDLRACSSERCDNRWDDDGDGLVDCDDPDCLGVAPCPEELCYDGVDNDGNGMTDCDDWGCAMNFPGCNAGLYPSEDAHHGLCGNGRDDDGDGREDHEDPDCLGYRSVLFLRDLNGGAFQRADSVRVELVVYADATDFAEVESRTTLPEGFEPYHLPEDATYLPEEHAVEWRLEALPWGARATLEVDGWIQPDLDFETELCFSATLRAVTPFELWESDDPDSVGAGSPTCIVVR